MNRETMRTAFCDDSAQDREAVQEILDSLDLHADIFDNGEALQAAFWRQAYDGKSCLCHQKKEPGQDCGAESGIVFKICIRP